MTILSILKKLHKKMTGQDTNDKSISGVLNSLQENYQGGNGEIDNSALILELDEETDSINVELKDIYDAALAGKKIYLFDTLNYYVLNDFHQGEESNEYYFKFISLTLNNGIITFSFYLLNNSKVLHFQSATLDTNEQSPI